MNKPVTNSIRTQLPHKYYSCNVLTDMATGCLKINGYKLMDIK